MALTIARHAPVGAGGERKRDLRAVRNAVSLVLRLPEAAEEGVARLDEGLVTIGFLEGNAREREQLFGICTVREVVERKKSWSS